MAKPTSIFRFIQDFKIRDFFTFLFIFPRRKNSESSSNLSDIFYKKNFIPFFQDSVRNKVVYVIQSVGENVNDALFEMQLLGYACKTASAHSIIGVLPYLPYSRQVSF